MPNHAASVFKQLREKAEERGREIGNFVQRGTTFERAGAKLRIDDKGIFYHIVFYSATGNEEQLGRFELKNRALTANLIKLLARSEVQRQKYSQITQREP